MDFGGPRDSRDWIKSVERRLGENMRAAGNAAAAAVGTVTNNAQRTPAAPVELTFGTSTYIEPGLAHRTRVRLTVDFPAVTVSNDAEDMTVSRYELWGQDETPPLIDTLTVDVPGLAVPGNSVPHYADPNPPVPAYGPMHELQTTEPNSFRVNGFVPGTLWRLRVRAIGTNGMPGDWSADLVVRMVSNDGPPPMPAAPTLRIERGTITAIWGGASVMGAAMPSDFRYAVLAYGKAPQPVTEVARFGRDGGFWVVADLPYYEPQHFRLKAVDEAGNESDWSAEAVGYTQPLVDTDVILSTIDGAVTALRNIDASVSVLANTVLARHIVASQDLTAKVGQFLEVDAGMVNANSIWADQLWVGLADAVLVRADMFIGKEFFGGTFTGSKFQTDSGDYEGVTLDANGLRGFDIHGNQTFNLDAGTGYVQTVGRFYTSPAGLPGIAIVPPADAYNGKDMGIWFAHDSHILAGGVTAGIWLPDPGPSGSAASNISIRGANNGGVTVLNGLRLDGNTSTIYGVGELDLNADYNVVINPGAGKYVRWTNAGAAYNMTSSSSANVYLHTDGNLFKSTSSMKYKDDVQDWDTGMKALDLRPRSWVAKTPMEGADPTERFVGFVAEEVLEHIPEFVVYDADGNVDALAYDRIVASIIPVLKNFNERLTAAGL